jgi:hypothetical protein
MLAMPRPGSAGLMVFYVAAARVLAAMATDVPPARDDLLGLGEARRIDERPEWDRRAEAGDHHGSGEPDH